MPRINLLKPKIQFEEQVVPASFSSEAFLDTAFESSSSSTPFGMLLQGLCKLCILFLIPAALFFYERHSFSQINKRLAYFNGLKRSLEASSSAEASSLLEEVKLAEKQKEELQKRVAEIEFLRKKRFVEIQTLELVQKSIPEKSWLIEVEVDQNRALLRGGTIEDEDISYFINQLSSSVLFTNVQLVRAEKQISDASQVVRKSFEIRCEMERRL